MLDQRDVDRNATLMILEGTLYWAGLSFLQGDTVITNFIRLTTGSAALAATVKTLMWLAAYTGFYQHMITLVEPEVRPDAIVLNALALTPLSFSTCLAGVIVERAGYLPVYLIMLVSGTVGWFLVRRLVPVTPK